MLGFLASGGESLSLRQFIPQSIEILESLADRASSCAVAGTVGGTTPGANRDANHIVAPPFAFHGFMPRIATHLRDTMPSSRLRVSPPVRGEDVRFRMGKRLDCGLARLEHLSYQKRYYRSFAAKFETLPRQLKTF